MKIHKAKKSLGQNFLKSEPALREIIKAGELSPKDTVLEIGPGKGVLTKKILETGCNIIAIEKDHELFAMLTEKFTKEIKNSTLVLVRGDVLEFNTKAYSLAPGAYKIIANIPYNITGAILKKFLTEKNQPERMVLMVQYEVAKRIVARNKKESILSISVKAYGNPEMVIKVPARYFSPAPKVDSAVIVIKNISRKMFEEHDINEQKFWEIVRLGFAHKRKKLSGNLKSICQGSTLTLAGIPENARAEDLGLKDWLKLLKS